MRTGRRTDGQIGRHKYAPTIIQTSFAVGNIGEHIEICYVCEKLKKKIERKKKLQIQTNRFEHPHKWQEAVF